MVLCAAVVSMNAAGGFEISKRLVKLAYAATLIQLVLDLYAVHFSKPSHVVGFVTGLALTKTAQKLRLTPLSKRGQTRFNVFLIFYQFNPCPTRRPAAP